MTKRSKALKENHGKKTKGGAEGKSKSKAESMEDRRRSYEHHDHCHKVQKSPTHTVPPKLSKYDELGALMAEEEKHKREIRIRRQHHQQVVHHHPTTSTQPEVH